MDVINKTITLKEILEITKGNLITPNKINLEVECNKFSKDTRGIKGGEIYIGLIGEKTNGGIYFEQALENGALGTIIQDIEITEEQKEKYKDKIIIKVDDTLDALQKIATLKREKFSNVKIVAVTGSVGKTSTKDIIANVLSQKYETLKTEGNFNNHIGVPITLLRLEDKHQVAVIEMGMNHFNEISKLTNIAKPNMCVITNIGTSHIGNLGSRENILKAKLEILEGNKEKDIIINNDNDLLHKFNTNTNKENINITTYGIYNDSDVLATDIKEEKEKSKFICKIKNNEMFEINIPVAGEHFIYNALCAVAVGNKLELSENEIKKGIETFELTKKRMDIEVINNDIKIINDSYNASYESMKGALENLSRYENRKIAVLGDMFELGEYAQELHENVGKEVAKSKIDILICSGENAKYIVSKAKEEGLNTIYYLKNNDEVLNKVKELMKEKDVILFKASNGMKFFEIVEQLKQNK